MVKLNEVENALKNYPDCTFEVTTTADAIHVSMEYMYGDKGKELWAKINSDLEALGGEWVSAGKDSHWHIPSNNEVAKPKSERLWGKPTEKPKPTESYGTIHCPYCNKVINFTVGAPNG